MRLTAGGWGTHYSVILWLTQTERLKQREVEGRERKGRASRENKCERKILNDQNSSHKTLGLRPCLLLGADKALQLCQLPSMLHHENTLKPQREVLNSRRDLSSIKPPSHCSVQCACWFFRQHALQYACCIAGFVSRRSQAVMSYTGDHEW